MSRWNRSDVIAVSSLIVSIGAIIIGIAIPEVRCSFGLQSESCTSQDIKPTDKLSRIELFLHYFSQVGRNELDTLNSFLVEKGLKTTIINASKLGANPPTKAEIRYYWKVDLPAAKELINLISQRQIPISSEPVLVPEKYRNTSDQPGKIELWLPN